MSSRVLPLSTFEQYIRWEDRPSYPWSCFVRMRFAGVVSHDALEAALRTIVPRHPLLCSRIERRGRRACWVMDPDALPRIEWLSGPVGGAMPAAGAQDLERDIGLKVFVVEQGEACDVTLQFHHACCDGRGIEAFMDDLLVAYAMASGQGGLRLARLRQGLLASRSGYGLSWRSLAALLPRQIPGLVGAGTFFSRSPVPLLSCRAPSDDDPPPPGYPATCTHTFTPRETRAYREAARRRGVTLNDLMVRDVYLALGEWRAARGESGDGWLRLMVPMNLRARTQRGLPAANGVGSIFLDRRSRDFADPEALLAGVASELAYVRERGLGLIFIYGLNLLRLLPGGMKRIARGDACMMSAIFSNVGRMLGRCALPRDDGRLVAGGLMLEGIDGVVPLRPYSYASFLVNEFAYRLSVTMHYDPRVISAKQAEELASTFAKRIRHTANVDASSSA